MLGPLRIAITGLVVAAGLLLYAMNLARLYAVHDDACRVIAANIANRPADRGALPDREIQALIKNLINASVIHGRVNADGAPSDLNGHPFVIRCEPKQVSVATEWSVWQPFGIKHEVKFELRDKAVLAGNRLADEIVGSWHTAVGDTEWGPMQTEVMFGKNGVLVFTLIDKSNPNSRLGSDSFAGAAQYKIIGDQLVCAATNRRSDMRKLRIDGNTLEMRDKISTTRFTWKTKDESVAACIRGFVTDLNASDREKRVKALQGVRYAGPEAREAIPALRDIMKDRESSFRQLALEALINIGPEENGVLSVVIEKLGDRGDPDIARIAAHGLGKFGASAVPALIDMLRNGDESNSVHAARALGTIGPDARAAIPALSEWAMSKGRADPSVATEAIMKIDHSDLARERQAHPESREALVAVLTNADIKWDGNPLGLQASIKGKPAKQLLSLGKQASPELRKALSDPKKFAAAHVLLTQIEKKEYPLSASHWNNLKVDLHADGITDLHPEQIEAIKAMWKEGLPDPHKPPTKPQDSPADGAFPPAAPAESEVKEIEQIRRRLDDKSLEPPMWTLIHMAEEKEQTKALEAFFSGVPDETKPLDLVEIVRKAGGLPKYRQQIAGLLGSRDATVRGFAAVWLADLGDPAYAKDILALLQAEDLPDAGGYNKNGDRGQAAFALGLLGAREHAKLLATYLHHRDESLRAGAAAGLARLKAKEYTTEIAALLRDDRERVVVSAIFALAELGAKDYSGQIADLLPTISVDVPEAAMKALVMLDAKDQAPRIVALLKDEMRSGGAAKALAMLGADGYLPEIASLLRAEDRHSRDDLRFGPDPLSRRAGLLARELSNRRDGLLALGILRADRYAAEVARYMRDKEDFVRQEAAWAIIMMEAKPHAAEAIGIIKSMQDQNISVMAGERVIPRDHLRQLDERFTMSLTRLGDVQKPEANDANTKELTALAAAASRDGDATKIQGTWKIESARYNGEETPEAVGATMTFTDKKVTFKKGDETNDDDYTLDPTKKPKHLDITGKRDNKPIVIAAVYEFLDNDTLTICNADPGLPRPSDFATRKGDGRSVAILKRVKQNDK